jgi:hypothetical protein
MKQFIKKKFARSRYELINKKGSSLLSYAANIPEQYRSAVLANLKILLDDLAFLKSLEKDIPTDSKNRSMPWFSYPALEFLETLDLSDKKVFEYGSGESSFYWSARAQKLVSVEHDRFWYERFQSRKPENATLVLEEDLGRFPATITRYPDQYDIIIIDAQKRFDCVKESLPYLADGGMILLDDAQRYTEIPKYLHEKGFFYFNFNGFKGGTPKRHALSVFIKNNGCLNFKQIDKPKCIGAYQEEITSE